MPQIDAGELEAALEIADVLGHPGSGRLAVARLHRLRESALCIDDARARLRDLADHRRERGLEQLQQRLLRHDQRPVPLDEGVMRADGSYRSRATDGDAEQTEPFITPLYGRGTGQDWIIPLVAKLVADDEQVIVFRNIKGATVGCARYLAASLGLAPSEAALQAMPDAISAPFTASNT